MPTEWIAGPIIGKKTVLHFQKAEALVVFPSRLPIRLACHGLPTINVSSVGPHLRSRRASITSFPHPMVNPAFKETAQGLLSSPPLGH